MKRIRGKDCLEFRDTHCLQLEVAALHVESCFGVNYRIQCLPGTRRPTHSTLTTKPVARNTGAADIPSQGLQTVVDEHAHTHMI